MELPIRFPTQWEKILAELARFSALTPAQRVEVIRGMIKAGELMMNRSPNGESMREYKRQQEENARQAFRDLAKRHGL